MNCWWGCAIRHAPHKSKNHAPARLASVAAVIEPRLEECSACSRSRSVIRSAAAGRAGSSLSFVRVKGPAAATAVPPVAFHTFGGTGVNGIPDTAAGGGRAGCTHSTWSGIVSAPVK